jgi:hypothetical protein
LGLEIDQLTVVLVLDVRRLERLCLHDKFEEEAASREDVDRLSVILSLADCIGDLRSIALQRANPITNMIVDRLSHFILSIASIAKIYNLNVEFRIKQNVFRLDVTVRDPARVGMSQHPEQLFEDIASCPFGELLGLVDQTVELSVLLNFHDVVEDSLHLAIRRTVDTANIEVSDLNNIAMTCLVRHPHLVEEHLEHLLLVAALAFRLLDLLVHYLDCNALVSH